MVHYNVSGKPSFKEASYGFYYWMIFFLGSLLGSLVYAELRDVDILDPMPINKILLLSVVCACASIALYHRYGFKEDDFKDPFKALVAGMASFVAYLVFFMFAFVVLSVEFSDPAPVVKEFVVTGVKKNCATFRCTDETLPWPYERIFGKDKLGERALRPGDRIIFTLFHSRMGCWWYHEKDTRFHFAP